MNLLLVLFLVAYSWEPHYSNTIIKGVNVNMGFISDKSKGDFAEKLVASYFSSFGWNVRINTDRKIPYDIEITPTIKTSLGLAHDMFVSKFTAEIKYDIMSQKTGNLAFEVLNTKSGKDSGINATEATVVIYVLPDKTMWIILAQSLRNFMGHTTLRMVSGGDDNSYMALCPKEFVLGSLFQQMIGGMDEFTRIWDVINAK